MDAYKEEMLSKSRRSYRSSAHLTSELSNFGRPQEIDSGEWCSFLVIQWLVKVSVRPHEGRVEEGKLQRVANNMMSKILEGQVVKNS